MKSLTKFLLGCLIALLGIAIFLMNVQVSSLNFYHFGGINSAPILLVVLFLCVIWAVISESKLPDVLIALDILLIIVSILMGTHFYLVRMNALTILTIITMIAVGIGLILVGLFKNKE